MGKSVYNGILLEKIMYNNNDIYRAFYDNNILSFSENLTIQTILDIVSNKLKVIINPIDRTFIGASQIKYRWFLEDVFQEEIIDDVFYSKTTYDMDSGVWTCHVIPTIGSVMDTGTLSESFEIFINKPTISSVSVDFEIVNTPSTVSYTFNGYGYLESGTIITWFSSSILGDSSLTQEGIGQTFTPLRSIEQKYLSVKIIPVSNAPSNNIGDEEFFQFGLIPEVLAAKFEFRSLASDLTLDTNSRVIQWSPNTEESANGISPLVSSISYAPVYEDFGDGKGKLVFTGSKEIGYSSIRNNIHANLGIYGGTQITMTSVLTYNECKFGAMFLDIGRVANGANRMMGNGSGFETSPYYFDTWDTQAYTTNKIPTDQRVIFTTVIDTDLTSDNIKIYVTEEGGELTNENFQKTLLPHIDTAMLVGASLYSGYHADVDIFYIGVTEKVLSPIEVQDLHTELSIEYDIRKVDYDIYATYPPISTNMILNLDPNDLTGDNLTVTTPGTYVSEWKNKESVSGTGMMVAVSDDLRPMATSELNNQPLIDAILGHRMLAEDTNDHALPLLSSPRTFFMLVNDINTRNGWGFVLAYGDNDTSKSFDISPIGYLGFQNGGFGVHTYRIDLFSDNNSGVKDRDPHLICIRYNQQPGGTYITDMTLIKDGIIYPVSNGRGYAGTSALNTHKSYFGVFGRDNQEDFRGSVGSMLGYDRALEKSEIDIVTEWYNTKYGTNFATNLSTENTIAWYPLTTDGSDIVNSYDLVTYGNPTYNGTSVLLDGKFDAFDTAPLPASPTSTISLWAKIIKISGEHQIIRFQSPTYGLTTYGNKYMLYDGSLNSSASDIVLGAWKRLTFVNHGIGGDLELYVNGVLTVTGTGTGHNEVSDSVIQFGKFDTTRLLNANLADIKIYNVVLSPNEILADFNVTKSTYGL